MARDYAKKSNQKPARKRNASRRKKQGFPTIAVLIVGILVGGFVGFLVYLKWLPSQPATQTVNKDNTVKEKNTAKQTEQAQPKQPGVPKYTFHDLLEDKEVIIPEDELKRSDKKISMQYIMPCGSFRNNEHADALKAKIAFLGFESKIHPVDANSGRWYRVQLGPYASKRQAESIRHRLQENDVNDCKIWGKKL